MDRVLWGELRFCDGVFRGAWLFTGCIVLTMFWGGELPRGFSWGWFLGSGAFSLFLSLPSFVLLLFLFWWPVRVLFLPSLCLSSGHRTDFRYLDRREQQLHVALVSVSSLCPGRPPSLSPSLLPLSALSLSLSLSLSFLSCKHAFRDPG